MLALFFEVRPKPGHESRYFDRAAALRPVLQDQPGLLFLDRYRSRSRPDVILSHSLWRDEEAITAWRTESRHRDAQAAGRQVHFADYRIRIAHVAQTWSAADADNLVPPPGESGGQAEPVGDVYVLAAIGREEKVLDGGEVFASLNTGSTYLTLCNCLTVDPGRDLMSRAETLASVTDLKLCAVSRDYGMYDREQAPAPLSPVTDVPA